MADIAPSNRLDLADETILRALEESDEYGPDLLRRIAGDRTDGREALLYPALYRLEREGSVRSRWEKRPNDGRPRRRLYGITRRGRARLSEATGRPREAVANSA